MIETRNASFAVAIGCCLVFMMGLLVTLNFCTWYKQKKTITSGQVCMFLGVWGIWLFLLLTYFRGLMMEAVNAL